MPPGPSRYRPDAPPDYRHRFHAGNVGDVWKHCALVATLGATAAVSRRVAYLDTHAGEGRYALAPTGEWTEGIGRLTGGAPPDGALGRYLALHGRLTGGAADYPGSPAFARDALGPEAEITLWERDGAAAERLRASTRDDVRTRVVHGDGLEALAGALADAEARADGVVALIDPPWVQKSDWITVPDALVAAARASDRATLLLWYPVKSLTRPNAMIARVRTAGLPAVIAELVTTPLSERRHRLNGSGMLFIRPPGGVLERLAAAAPALGARCATRDGAWTFRIDA